MSRTRKLQNKRRVRESVVFNTDEKGRKLGRRKGPASTTPLHGKRNRLPYDAQARKKKLQPRAT